MTTSDRADDNNRKSWVMMKYTKQKTEAVESFCSFTRFGNKFMYTLTSFLSPNNCAPLRASFQNLHIT